MGNVSIDFSLNNIWHSWFKFKSGKKITKEFDYFQYYLEDNLWWLYLDLNQNTYQHGPYRHFTIIESKRRDLAVATIRDRVIHRLVYEYLLPIYDPTFIYDVWSCRKNKGLLGAINRTQEFIKKYPNSFIWRADVSKFFKNVKQDVLLAIISRKITDAKALRLIQEIIISYNFIGGNERERERVKTSAEFPLATLPARFLPIFILMNLIVLLNII